MVDHEQLYWYRTHEGCWRNSLIASHQDALVVQLFVLLCENDADYKLVYFDNYAYLIDEEAENDNFLLDDVDNFKVKYCDKLIFGRRSQKYVT